MNSGQQPLYQSTPQPAYGSAPWQAPAQPNSAPTSKSLGVAITLLVFAALGIIGTFLPFLTIPYYEESLKGWDAPEILRDYGEFSAGPTWIVLGSIVAAICALVIIVNMNNGTNSNRVALGILSLIAGIAVLGASGATYSALDNILIYEDEIGSMGIGLWLGCLSGLAITILGILILALPKATQVK
jgi:putative copper export protein